MEFLPTVIFLPIYKKIGIIRADFFKLEFLHYPLLYSAAAVFFIWRAPRFCLLLMLATRLLLLGRSTLAPPLSAICCCPSTRSRPRWEKSRVGGEGKHRWKAHAGHSWQTQSGARISITKPLVDCRWLEAYFTLPLQSLYIFLTLSHWAEAVQFYGVPQTLYYLEINSSLAIYQRKTLAVGPSLWANALSVFFVLPSRG